MPNDLTSIGLSSAAPLGPSGDTSRVLSTNADGAFGRSLEMVLGGAPALTSCSAVNPLLLHEIQSSDAQRRDREAARRGKELLEALGALQRALLGSGQIGEALGSLTVLVDRVPHAADPSLATVVREIALRATVELARLGHK